MLWCFERANISSYIQVFLAYFSQNAIIDNDCRKLLTALNVKQIFILDNKHNPFTEMIPSLLIENKTSLRAVVLMDSHVWNVCFPDNLELLHTQSGIFFSELYISPTNKFTKLIELNLKFEFQVHQKFIKKLTLHLPTFQALTISVELYINIGLIHCLLESNPTVTTLSIYYQGFQEIFELLYQSMSHVKVLNLIYQFWNNDTGDFNIESILYMI